MSRRIRFSRDYSGTINQPDVMQNPAPPPHCSDIADYLPQHSYLDLQAGLLPDFPDDSLLGMLTVLDAATGQ